MTGDNHPEQASVVSQVWAGVKYTLWEQHIPPEPSVSQKRIDSLENARKDGFLPLVGGLMTDHAQDQIKKEQQKEQRKKQEKRDPLYKLNEEDAKLKAAQKEGPEAYTKELQKQAKALGKEAATVCLTM